MKNNTKKLVQMLACLICLLILGASTVYAASYQAKIGKKNYKTIQDAVNAVKSGQTIKLIKNVELTKDEVIELNRNVKYTIDMNGKVISEEHEEQDDEEGEFDYKSAVQCMRATMGNVTIQNGKMKALKASGSGIILSGRASVTLKGGSYNNEQISVHEQARLTVENTSFNNTSAPPIWQSGGKITINGTTIKTNENCIYSRGGKIIINSGKLTGGSFAKNYPAIYLNQDVSLVIKKCELKSDGGGIYADEKGKPSVEILGGTYASKKNPICIGNRSGKLKISGGTFNSIGQSVTIWTNAPTKISGGKFTAKNTNALVDESELACTITGGTFTNNSKKSPTLYSIFHFKKVSGAKVVNKSSNKKNLTIFNALM